MTESGRLDRLNLSRRGFLRAGGAVGLSALGASALAACSSDSGSSGSSGGTIKFWDMPWAAASYNTAGKKLVSSYKGPAAAPKAAYQTIQWNNFTQTFSSAIASKTGPAVSSGGGFQAFQFADQGAIAYADKVIDAFKKDGTYDDFLPGTVEAMKTDKGYAAVPWQLDMRVWWYRKSLLEQAGVEPPTTWAELLSTGKILAGKGMFGYGTGGGAGNNIAAHSMVMMMINNGGGLFSKDSKVDVVTDANTEAMEFVLELASNGIIDPASVSYTADNELAQWKNKKFAMGIQTPGLDETSGITDGDLVVMDTPLTGPNGDKGCLVFENNIMMYTNTPSQEGSEAFLEWYIKNMKTYWQQGLLSGLPVLKSIAELPEFKKQTQKVACINNWQPVAKSYAAVGDQINSVLAKVDGGQPLNVFTQTMLSGKTTAKAALQKLQSDIDALG